MIELFIKGIIVGIGVSVPLGPLGVLCIQRTLSKGKSSGFITGIGTAIADTFYSAIGLLGLTFISGFIETHQEWFMTIGGIIVGFFGLRLFMVNPVKQIKKADEGSKKHIQDFFSAMFMTLSNPGALFLVITVMAFVGINKGVNAEVDFVASLTLLGIFLGAMSWWWTLSSLINRFRNKFKMRQLMAINKISGVIVILLGIISTFEGLYRLIFE